MLTAAKRDVLAATQLFASLALSDLNVLADLAQERHVDRGAAVIRRGDPDCSLLLLVHGRLRAGSVSLDGRELTMGMLEAGAVLGEIALLDGRPRSLDVIAMADSLLLSLDRTVFLPFLIARPDLMLRVMVLLCDRLRRASKAFEDVAFASLSARLASLLLTLAKAHGVPGPDGVRIRLRLSQREMSAQVAATRERVNKQLRQWHDSGVLGMHDGQLVLRRPEDLRALLADAA
ncbi:MAG: Crp/Fnr family transcriptional regulator [Gemmatimonadaceae bacterium]|nr:Crp/Fnr family transcriptional regulator [Acetobacteraceae bacterium]